MTAGPSQLFFRISVFNQFKFDLPKPPQVDKIRGLITTIKNNGVDPDGTITEEIADLLFHGKDGYFRQNGKLGSNNGFDGLFIKPAIDFTKPIDEIDIEGIIDQ
ncbi:hypothetical protein DYBT9275_02379 [Dyadobacter sp. CECT 9275]|uniref:Uncharacterized protein n=1 Tax=Dyadobacter helix TaxID=2822344 RepID=A0A916JBQ6_9BACT|nr:hypothetical protein [Dyadobacter sp. CECT 9275]CAG5000077.1 hypothetical protein DYBT9275_02379 [Dyadobacter sp. CECT 9275]